MQKLIDLKQRIRTVENIRTVTRTLATVSAAKLSRTRARAAGARMYADRMRDALRRQQSYLAASGVDPATLSPLLKPRPSVDAVMLVHLSGDRGMCGAYNVTIDRLGARWVDEQQALGRHVSVMAKGVKGERYLARKTSAEIVRAEDWSRAGVRDEDVDRIRTIVLDAFLGGSVQEVYAAYTRFLTPLRRQPKIERLLPVEFPDEGAQATVRGASDENWWYEPDFAGIMDEMVESYLRLEIEDALLQSFASEQGARMITMEEATERASRMLHECRLLYNRLRREAITTDLLGVLFASRLRESEETPDRVKV